MNLSKEEQKSEEWWKLKVGKIGGTRFGAVLSNRKNRLVYQLMNEILSGQCVQDDYVSDDMLYGMDNEDEALRLYSEQTGVEVEKIGMILSESCDIHIASPDGLSGCNTIVQEVKSTMNGDIHLQRYFEGLEPSYVAQCVNYFAVAPEIQQVHFISYCGYRPERPMFYKVLNRKDYTSMVDTGLKKLASIELDLLQKLDEYSF